MGISVSEFLSDLKLRGQIQSNQRVFADADLLTIANREIRMVIVPKILSLRERYFSGYKDYTISSKRRYRLPPRCAGGRVFDIKIYPDGLANPTTEYSLKQNHPSDIDRGQAGFYIDGDDIVLNSGQDATGAMRVFYPIRPPLMVASPAVSTTISSVSGVLVTMASPPVAGTYECIRNSNGNTTITPSLVSPAGSVAADTDDLSGDTTERFAYGDIVCTSGQTPNVPLPDELTDWLSQRTLMRYLEILGHADEVALAGAKLQDIEKDAMAFLSPRIENEEKYVADKETLGWRMW